jgi:Ca2+/Na+ antiporter
LEEVVRLKRKNTIGVFYNLFFIIALYFALFVLLQLGSELWAVLVAGIVIITSGYLFFTFKAQQRQEEKEKEQIIIERKLDELLNAQRAIYTITKRGMGKDGKLPFESQGDADVVKLLEKIASGQGQQISEARKYAETQVNALKTVAWYNKENTKQMIINLDKNINTILALLQGSQPSVSPDGVETETLSRRNEAMPGEELGEKGIETEETTGLFTTMENELKDDSFKEINRDGETNGGSLDEEDLTPEQTVTDKDLDVGEELISEGLMPEEALKNSEDSISKQIMPDKPQEENEGMVLEEIIPEESQKENEDMILEGIVPEESREESDDLTLEGRMPEKSMDNVQKLTAEELVAAELTSVSGNLDQSTDSLLDGESNGQKTALDMGVNNENISLSVPIPEPDDISNLIQMSSPMPELNSSDNMADFDGQEENLSSDDLDALIASLTK